MADDIVLVHRGRREGVVPYGRLSKRKENNNSKETRGSKKVCLRRNKTMIIIIKGKTRKGKESRQADTVEYVVRRQPRKERCRRGKIKMPIRLVRNRKGKKEKEKERENKKRGKQVHVVRSRKGGEEEGRGGSGPGVCPVLHLSGYASSGREPQIMRAVPFLLGSSISASPRPLGSSKNEVQIAARRKVTKRRQRGTFNTQSALQGFVTYWVLHAQSSPKTRCIIVFAKS